MFGGLTTDQWLRLLQFGILPAFWWMLKFAVKEMKAAVDTRAATVADVRDEILRKTITAQFDAHEAKDVKRNNDLIELINTIKT